MHRLSVVIPTRDRVADLLGSLEALSRLEEPRALEEVLVVDDGSEADVAAEVGARKLPLPVRVLRHPVSRGPSAARNTGVSEARAPFVWFLDDDVLVDPGAASAYLEHLRNHDMSRASATGPVRQWPEGMTPFEFWTFNGGSQFIHCRIAPERRLDAGDEHFCCANLLCPTGLLREHPFDERFTFPRYEDRELGYRLQKVAGHRIHLVDGASAVHSKRLSFPGWLARFDRFAANALLFASLHQDDPQLEVRLGIRRARELGTFDEASLDQAVDLVNALHGSFWHLERDATGSWGREVLFASFRLLQEFFRMSHYRRGLGLEPLRDPASGRADAEARARILERLRPDS